MLSAWIPFAFALPYVHEDNDVPTFGLLLYALLVGPFLFCNFIGAQNSIA